MKNILFLLLAFLCLPSWGADEPKKKEPTQIDLVGRLESDNERSLIFPLEAFENDVELNLISTRAMTDVTITVSGIHGVLFSQVLSLEEGGIECISLSDCTAGTYTLTIVTPNGTYLSGMFTIE
ncbi:MAG: DUF3244 domain-containing protein [Bacteroidaceae bacterium]|nr:DUF3244 domain-containing protein [Bacteroidaceae bacterium]